MFTLYIYEINEPSVSSKETLVHQSTHNDWKDALAKWHDYLVQYPFAGKTRYYHIIDNEGKHWENFITEGVK